MSSDHAWVTRREITEAMAAQLVAEQFPEWADLTVVPVAVNGWDNTTFRLGEDLSVRLPSADGYVAQVAKEHRWLPALAPHLRLPIPEPVAMGRPGVTFPWPWSVYRWIDGEPASDDRIADRNTLAADLARFLTALQAIDARDGPPADAHSFFRGGPLVVYDPESRAAIEGAADVIDAAACVEVWEKALDSTWDRPPVWVHGDIAPSNLLIDGGALRAVIDFGCSAVGDPACDLVMAWTFFDGESRSVFRDALTLDEATWDRGRGWALWKALVTHVGARRTGLDPDAAPRRFGWRVSALEVVESVLTS